MFIYVVMDVYEYSHNKEAINFHSLQHSFVSNRQYVEHMMNKYCILNERNVYIRVYTPELPCLFADE